MKALRSRLRLDREDGLPCFGDPPRPLTLVRNVRARRMKLSVDPRDGTIRLVLPPKAQLRRAIDWVETMRGWVEVQLGQVVPSVAIAPGATIPYRDTGLLIDWCASRPRAPRAEGGRLILGGPQDTVKARVLRWLRGEAVRLLDAETRAIAAQAGVTVTTVSVGDPRSRWGSCAADGAIRYSWRLLLAPDFVRRATVAHEVAHRVHMNHSSAFHALVEALHGEDPTLARDWLREHGAALHGIGRSS